MEQPMTTTELATALASVEDWLREQPARHADDMADAVHAAWLIVEDLIDRGE